MIEIQAKDCCPFNNQYPAPIIDFISLHNIGVKSFFTNRINTDNPIAFYDNQQRAWMAGRFVGEAVFESGSILHKISINPRFGNHFLFHLLEEVFNVRISKSLYSQDNFQAALFIKRIISFIWLQKLAKANQYGFPKKNLKRQHTGDFLRGRLLISKTIIPLKSKGSFVYLQNEKTYDNVILGILFQAYSILKKSFFLGTFNIPQNVTDILDHLEATSGILNQPISEHAYCSIRYRDIYYKFKEVVDFSWLIIKNKEKLQKGTKIGKGHSFFIDMAELWELYIRSILRKYFSSKGWHIQSEEILAYKGKAFQRKLIPDIVMKSNKDIVVLDAKYKRMRFIESDFDREDFFQIHTYAGAIASKHKLNSIGLIYPLSKDISIDRSPDLIQEGLFYETKGNTRFFCDGIYIQENLNSKEDLVKCEQDFCVRLENKIL